MSLTSNLKPILPNPLTLECNVTLKSLRNNEHEHKLYLKEKQKVNVFKRVTMSIVTSLIIRGRTDYITFQGCIYRLLDLSDGFAKRMVTFCLSDAGCNNKPHLQRISTDHEIGNGNEAEWKSQPNYNHYSVGSLTSAASVLFSANKYQRLAQFFDLAGIQWISKTSFYAIQNRYLYGIVNRKYIAVLEDMKQAKLVDLGGGKRCNSPGHNAKITKSRSS